MRIDGVVVLYNPEDAVLNNILRYSSLLDCLFVVDNSTKPNEELNKKLEAMDKVELISLGDNLGIAKALKVGLEAAINDKAEYCLTMDQDSIFPSEDYDKIKKYLSDYKGQYAIINLNYQELGTNEGEQFEGIRDVHHWITSGGFIYIEDYKLVHGFKEELFIDLVDFDLCQQFYAIGKKMGVIGEIYLKHKIGNAVRARFLWKHPIVDNHALVRYYYMYRNLTYLYKRDKVFYKPIKYEYDRQWLNQMFCSKERWKRLRMKRRGIKDAKKGILGPYKGK